MLVDRRGTVLPFAAVGGFCVVAGGLVAAATAAAPSTPGSWAAAYLVLVAGAAQIALGAGRAFLAPRVPSFRRVAAEVTGWNAGNAAVIAGTLVGVVPLVYAGGALLVVVLALLAGAVLGTGEAIAGWPPYLFLLLVVVLLVSIPVGLVLARGGL